MTRTAIATAYGNPSDVVSIVDTDLPAPEPGQAIVDVRAAGLNPIDVKTVSGAMGSDPDALPLSIGFEAAGVVSTVGVDATDSAGVPLAVGDEVVVYRARGGLASAIVADSANIHRKPHNVPFDVAAGLLLVGVTAADTIATAGVSTGDTVLIHGGAGAVGTVAVQLALAVGATVIATASPANHEFLNGLGATPVAYGDGLADRVRAAAPDGINAAIDTVGTDEAIDVSTEFVADRSRIVSIAAWGRSDDAVIVNGSTEQSRANRTAAIPKLLDALANDSLVIDVAKTFPLDDAGVALTELGSAHPRGKFIVRP